MRITPFVMMRACTAFVLAALASSSLVAGPAVRNFQDQEKNKPKVSEGEAKAAKAINSLPDAAAKLKAAVEFVKKYPTSTIRQQVSGYVAGQIAGVKDPLQKLSLAEEFLSFFTEQQEQDSITPAVIDAYLGTNQTDEAFATAAAFLTRNPDNVGMLVKMMQAGTDLAKQKNLKYIAQSEQHGMKAIQLLEADTNPLHSNDSNWANYKAMLPQFYQSVALLALMRGGRTDARGKLEKAISLNPSDPFNYFLLGDILNTDYQEIAQRANSLPEGKTRSETMQKANEALDQVIDVYAHAIALIEAKPQFQQARDQIMQDLTSYYKYRHNQSVEGLQQLIDKYKVQPKP